MSRCAFNLRGDIMCEEREKVRCGCCELVQWSDQANCRRCGAGLPEPLVKIVERVVEKVVIRHDPECIQSLAQSRELIAAAADRLTQRAAAAATPAILAQVQETGAFPTMTEV